MYIFLHVLQTVRNINTFPLTDNNKNRTTMIILCVSKCEMVISFKLTKIILSKTKINYTQQYTHTVT